MTHLHQLEDVAAYWSFGREVTVSAKTDSRPSHAQLDSVTLDLLARLIVIFYLLCTHFNWFTVNRLFTVEKKRGKKELKKYQLDRSDVRSKC